MSINDDTISVDVWDTVRAILVAATPKVTNSTTAANKTASVEAAYDDKKLAVPQIIINPISMDESNFKFGHSEGKKFLNVTVECYHDKSLGIAQLSDTCKKAIKDACENGTLIGMDLVGISESYGFIDPNFAKLHMKSITFTFDRE